MKKEDMCSEMINELKSNWVNLEFNNYENVDKLKRIVNNYFKNAVVITSDNVDTKKNCNSNKNNFIIFVLNNDNNSKTKNSKTMSEKKIRQKIKNELNNLNYNYSYKGTKYLEDSIYLLYKRGYENDNLSKDIYPIIAKKYNTKIDTVKCNILQASNNSYYECEQEVMEKYFGFQLSMKPKTKDIMFAVMRKINLL